MKYLIIVIGLIGVFGIVRYAKQTVVHIETDKLNPPKESPRTIRINFSELVATYPKSERGIILSKLAVDLLPEERKIFVEEIIKNIKGQDREVVLSITSKLSKMKLKKEEVELIVSNLAYVKSDIKFKNDLEGIGRDLALINSKL
jgi:hypothetical protein